MTELAQRLEALGLSQYFNALVEEGFDTWKTVLDVTESDLTALHFKLGHRRKLQRAIAEYRGQAHDRPLPITLNKSFSGDESGPESQGRHGDGIASTTSSTSTKRKYRRHPKPDENAPERPPSAYVIFSNQVREMLKGQDLSFTEIAKVVGERWQVLAPDAREACEQQASAAKEKYYSELAEYKKTPQYEAYQKYLEEFKAKHAVPRGSEGKRSKLEVETSNSNRSTSRDHGDSLAHRRLSSTLPETHQMSQHRAESSPPLSSRIASTPYPGKSASPATHSLSGFNSPRLLDHYSPISASPRSRILPREDNHPKPFARDPGLSDPTIGAPSGAYWQPSSITTTHSVSFPHGAYHLSPIDLPSRRPYREPALVPPLTHEDTTLSSHSAKSGRSDSVPTGASILPILNAPKPLRILPHPIPTVMPVAATVPSTPALLSGGQSPDLPHTPSLAALLRAGELASAADEARTERERPS